MTQLSIHALPGQIQQASALAAIASAPVHQIGIHQFPDGESRVTIVPVAGTAVLYASLDRPNDKLVNLLFAAAALRANGANRLILVAPYMCYMRQDTAFHPGEAVSQQVIGQVLAERFDRIVTVDPHLHRTPRIDAAFPGTQAFALSAAPVIADYLAQEKIALETLVVGPDSEAYQWVEAVARPLGLEFIVGRKVRDGDRQVSLTLPGAEGARGRPVLIVDDVISSGVTIVACAQILKAKGARSIDVFGVHALFGSRETAEMNEAGVSRIRSTDSVSHPTNVLGLAPLLARAL